MLFGDASVVPELSLLACIARPTSTIAVKINITAATPITTLTGSRQSIDPVTKQLKLELVKVPVAAPPASKEDKVLVLVSSKVFIRPATTQPATQPATTGTERPSEVGRAIIR